MAYASNLVRFISNVPVLSDGTIPINMVDEGVPFTSDLYEANYSLSAVARMVQSLLKGDKIEIVEVTPDSTTIVERAFDSNLASAYPEIYLLLRAVVLESFSLLYMIDNDPAQLQYMSQKDIRRVRTNVNFIADFFSIVPAYYFMIENMRDMNISLGYLENQIEVIMSERGVN